jgi:hypothetical protein
LWSWGSSNQWVFFWVKFCHLVIQKKKRKSVNYSKYVCEKIAPKLPDFEENISEITIFREFPPGHRNIVRFLNISTFLSDMYFPLLPSFDIRILNSNLPLRLSNAGGACIRPMCSCQGTSLVPLSPLQSPGRFLLHCQYHNCMTSR